MFNSILLYRLSRRTCHALWCKDNIQVQFQCCLSAGTLVRAHTRRNLLNGVEIDDEIVLDSEDCVCREPRVVFGVNLCDDWLVLVMCNLLHISELFIAAEGQERTIK